MAASLPAALFVSSGPRCPASAPVKDYHVSAINVEITLSRFLDYFPGYMYVLKENVEKVRGEEAANRAAREKENDPGAVHTGIDESQVVLMMQDGLSRNPRAALRDPRGTLRTLNVPIWYVEGSTGGPS
jgi:hypothetical protein